MRIRHPQSAGDISIAKETIPESSQSSQSYQVTVITPVYGGGVSAGDPDRDMPIRASAIRGQLRYWWRLLNKNGRNALSSKELFEKERELWGSMGESDETQKDLSSKILIRVKITKRISQEKFQPCCKYDEIHKDGRIKYQLKFEHGIPQYALFPGQGKPPDANDYNPDKDRPHTVILPEIEFELKVIIDSQIAADDKQCIKESVRWWANFGGIGARTRRGAGSVKIKDISPISADEASQYGCRLIPRPASNATQAWNNAINKLQHFRQGVGVGRKQKKDAAGNPETYGNGVPAQGRSHWPEPDSIREITGKNSSRHKPSHTARISFPRARFGMPIVFKFNNKDEKSGDPQQTQLQPQNAERMASPLILKARATRNGYQSIALLLPHNHINNLSLTLKDVPDQPAALDPQQKDRWKSNGWDKWPQQWWSASRASQVDPIKKYKSDDPLTAFMTYFDKE